MLKRRREEQDSRNSETARSHKRSGALAIVISLVAVSISGATFFYSSLLKRDLLQYSLVGRADAYFDVESRIVKLTTDQRITFINSGNRPIAIVDMNYEATQPKELADPNSFTCDAAGHFSRIPVSFEPFVIKEGEIVVKKLTVSSGPLGLRGDELELSAENKGRDEVYVGICLSLVYVTAGRPNFVYSRPVFAKRMPKTEESKALFPAPIFARAIQPRTLVEDWDVQWSFKSRITPWNQD